MDKLTFDSVKVGDDLPTISRSVNQETFWKNAVASFDYNPVHCDPDWVKTAQPFGIPVTVAHGMMTMSFMLTVVSNWAYSSMLRITKMTSKFIRPVPAGWTLKCSGVISEKHIISPGKNYVVIDLTAVNQDGQPVAVCQTEVIFLD
ncbi:MAG: MaoC family dehydratase [Candidatus Hodarchaeota archaeon]